MSDFENFSEGLSTLIKQERKCM